MNGELQSSSLAVGLWFGSVQAIRLILVLGLFKDAQGRNNYEQTEELRYHSSDCCCSAGRIESSM
jgi:hypothetical protein